MLTDDELAAWRIRWEQELMDLLRRIPPGIKTQIVEYKGVKIGIQLTNPKSM
jgi:hypothetical protein